MNKLFLSLCFIVLTSSFGLSQNSDDYNKNEFYVGYSNQQIENGKRDTFNGFEGSYVRNFHRYFGVKVAFNAGFKNRKINSTAPNTVSFEVKESNYNYLGGIQIKDNASTKKLKPFAHLLVGVANERGTTICSSCSAGNSTVSLSGFSGAVGGGLDINLSEKVDLRIIQVDYNPTHTTTYFKNNFRFGIGIVFK